MLRCGGSRRGSRVRFFMFGRTQTAKTNPESCSPDLPDLLTSLQALFFVQVLLVFNRPSVYAAAPLTKVLVTTGSASEREGALYVAQEASGCSRIWKNCRSLSRVQGLSHDETQSRRRPGRSKTSSKLCSIAWPSFGLRK